MGCGWVVDGFWMSCEQTSLEGLGFLGDGVLAVISWKVFRR